MKRFTSLSLLLSLFCLPVWAQLSITDGTVRLLPPGVPNTSAYFNIHNQGDKQRVIVGASSELVKKVELHTHTMQGDMMMMRQVNRVDIPARETVKFESGGLHLMMFGLKQPLTAGQKVKIDLQMQDGETLTLEAQVAAPKSTGHHHHH